MTVEEIRASLRGENDKFPVGMRVLAVDDDPTCLKVLGGLLRNCQYQVTTTSQAKTALKMLRENRNRFDLVISDVRMPDMDGFKLLEHVGLEMDLPVIMLSAYSDTELVMKGIKHGACDYLVKPVRIEELRNIWQHVIRRRKSEPKPSTLDNAHQENREGGKGPAPTDDAEQNGKLNRKRKDEEEEEDAENGQENEDPATQKKPRVVWSMELHGKFVAAVNQLGLEKAVPKRILDMMNVEGITRENVASHLQKYRLFLKRIRSMENQQANMVAAFARNDSSLVRINSLHGLRDFRTMSGRGRLSNTGISSYQTGGILGRLNTATGVSLHSLSSSALFHQGQAQNLSNSTAIVGKLQPYVSPANQNASLFQGIPTQLDLNQLQQNKCTSRIAEFNSAGDSTNFANNVVRISNNPLFLQRNLQQTHCGGVFGNQSTFKVTSMNSEPHNAVISSSKDNGRCNENWQSTINGLSTLSSNPLRLGESFNNGQLPTYSLRNSNLSTGLHIQSSPLDFSSTNIISAPMEDSVREIQCQATSNLVNDAVQNINQAIDQRWGEHTLDYTHNSNQVFSTLDSIVPANGAVDPLSQVLDQNNVVCNTKIDASLISQSNSNASTLQQLSEIGKSAMSGDYHLEQMKSLEGFVCDNSDSFDDIVNEMIKQGQDGTLLMDGELEFDAYSFG